jgi:hypothetical protein
MVESCAGEISGNAVKEEGIGEEPDELIEGKCDNSIHQPNPGRQEGNQDRAELRERGDGSGCL